MPPKGGSSGHTRKTGQYLRKTDRAIKKRRGYSMSSQEKRDLQGKDLPSRYVTAQRKRQRDKAAAAQKKAKGKR